MRIGISGSGGTGKTTLANLLSEQLEYGPVIKEGVREFMETKGIKHLRQLEADGTKELQEWILERKLQQEEVSKYFVADKTTLDCLAYCLRWLSREDGIDVWLNGYLSRCLKHAVQTYDLIILVPWNVFPIEDDGVRSAKKYYQLEIQLILQGLCAEMDARYGKHVHYLQGRTVEDRVAEVMTLVKLVECQDNYNVIQQRIAA